MSEIWFCNMATGYTRLAQRATKPKAADGSTWQPL